MTAFRTVPARERETWTVAAEAGARALRAGAVLAHPTGTVYGIGAAGDALAPVVARLKGREADRPLLRIAPDVETLRRRHPGLRWSARAGRLAGAFWPGPLTLVVPDGSETGLAARVVDHPLTRAVLREAEATMSSTSLNRSGAAPARTPADAAEALEGMPPVEVEVVWLDAGPLAPSAPSTILSLLEDRARLVRDGAVAPAEIEACLGEEVERG